MGETPTIDEIMGAINASGYLMEQEVANQFERRGMHVRTNVAFEDPEEGKSREIDVTAFHQSLSDEEHRIAVNVEIIAECKNSSNPLVFIARPKNRADVHTAPDTFMFPYGYRMEKDLGGGRAKGRDIQAFKHLGFDQVYNEHLNSWKAVQFCRLDRAKGSWTASHGGLYDAMFYPIAKAITARVGELPKSRNARSPDDWRFFWFLFPVVVTSSDLFLVDSTEAKPEPRSVEYVTFKRELKAKKIGGTFSLTFVRQDALETFLVEVVDAMASKAAALIKSDLHKVQQTILPWVD